MSPKDIEVYLRKLDPGCAPRVLSNGWVESRCPFAPWLHSGGFDRRPSFACSSEGAGGYYCHSCGKKGRLDWLPEHLASFQRERHDELHALAAEAQAGVLIAIFDEPEVESDPVPLHRPSWTDVFPPATDAPEAMAYLASRRISAGTTARIGFMWDEKAKRVVLQVADIEHLWGFTGRTTIEHQIKVKNYGGLQKRRHVLGVEHWRGDRPLILVEGLFAFARLFELGVDATYDIGCVMGSELSSHQAAIIAGRDHSRVVLMFDDDEAGSKGVFGRDGQGGAQADLRRLGCEVSVPAYPGGKTDPDDLTFDEAMSMAEPYDELAAFAFV